MQRSPGYVSLLFVFVAASAPAQTFTTLVNFNSTVNGGAPTAPLAQGSDGRFYGATANGGSGYSGTIFAMTTEGALTTIYSFAEEEFGVRSPRSGLVLATNGEFYGTTNAGGDYLAGTIFEIDPAGLLSEIYSFCPEAGCDDGLDGGPVLVQAANLKLYGTSQTAGGYGTIFEISVSGAFRTLTSAQPSGELSSMIQAANGDLYGTDLGGIFKVTLQGTFSSVYTFTGASPCGGVVQAANGDFYGTTGPGSPGSSGAIFKLAPSGTLTFLHRFDSADPNPCGLILATDGNFYGTTSPMGPYGYGTVFKISPAGAFSTLHTFDLTDGAYPGALVQGTDGNLYGTTFEGGTSGGGTIFTISTGLAPFVKTLPTMGEVGESVTILGYNLAGATSVTFNGTPASFTVNPTGTSITTTVPAGATTGTVQVVAPGSTLSSNIVFRVGSLPY